MSSILGDFNRIHVMSGGAPKEAFALLAPKFEQQTGNKVKFTYAVITELREKLGAFLLSINLPSCRQHPLPRVARNPRAAAAAGDATILSGKLRTAIQTPPPWLSSWRSQFPLV